MNRFAAHRGSIAANLFTGTARSHRGNLAASLKLEKLYASPVLFSGLASLALSKTEVNIIDQHYMNTIRALIKCHSGTPQPFVLFLSGSLPGKAVLHLRQLSLFSMVTRLPKNPLFTRAKHILTTGSPTSNSWFWTIRDICLQYGLPHPLIMLENPLRKETFKRLAKSHVIDFKPEVHSLSRPHPILWTPG